VKSERRPGSQLSQLLALKVIQMCLGHRILSLGISKS
jgi:hypothetical protein